MLSLEYRQGQGRRKGQHVLSQCSKVWSKDVEECFEKGMNWCFMMNPENRTGHRRDQACEQQSECLAKTDHEGLNWQ